MSEQDKVNLTSLSIGFPCLRPVLRLCTAVETVDHFILSCPLYAHLPAATIPRQVSRDLLHHRKFKPQKPSENGLAFGRNQNRFGRICSFDNILLVLGRLLRIRLPDRHVCFRSNGSKTFLRASCCSVFSGFGLKTRVSCRESTFTN